MSKNNWITAVVIGCGLTAFLAYAVWAYTTANSRTQQRMGEAGRQARRDHFQPTWDKITKDNFDDIEIGMSWRDVDDLIGRSGTTVEESVGSEIVEHRNGLDGEYTKKIILTYDAGKNVIRKRWWTASSTD